MCGRPASTSPTSSPGSGLYPDAPKPPCVVGYEVAGTIDAVGASVTGFHSGDRVVALTRFGGYADVVTVPIEQVFHFPDLLSDAEAAAVPVNYLTAALALYRMAALTPGETVLIHNAGGGVGIAAIQLARLRRAVVLGTASAGKHAALQELRRRAHHRLPRRRRGAGREGDHQGARRRRHPRSDRRPQLPHQLPHARAARAADHLRPLGGRARANGAACCGRSPRGSSNPRFDPMSLINRNRGVFGLHVGHLWSERRQLAPLMEMLMSELQRPAHRSRSSRAPSRWRRPPTRTGSSRAGRTSAKSC